ncbi:hypothetical protein [Flavobacterium sp. UBA7680]|uniref:hypothetical protein n=1 Tax=Flavobacterium sp. UBA7680 TaxID=1946559 RepID=UPI0025B9CE70|nr:hypothetical protein [Flavobacterium sp. UBA7680]
MKHILFFILFFAAVTVSAQTEFGTKFKPIPAPKFSAKKKTPIPQVKDPQAETTDIPSIKTPNVFDNTSITPKSQLQVGAEKSNFSMAPKNDFANPGDQYVPKMEKDLDKALKDVGLKEDRGILVRKNIDFGEFTTKSEYFVVRYRDFIVVDGDMVKVSQNFKVIQGGLEMGGSFREFRITLPLGINRIEFEALNTGTSGGNTAEFQIFDSEGKLIDRYFWDNLDAGYKGTLTVVRVAK